MTIPSNGPLRVPISRRGPNPKTRSLPSEPEPLQGSGAGRASLPPAACPTSERRLRGTGAGSMGVGSSRLKVPADPFELMRLVDIHGDLCERAQVCPSIEFQAFADHAFGSLQAQLTRGEEQERIQTEQGRLLEGVLARGSDPVPKLLVGSQGEPHPVYVAPTHLKPLKPDVGPSRLWKTRLHHRPLNDGVVEIGVRFQCDLYPPLDHVGFDRT